MQNRLRSFISALYSHLLAAWGGTMALLIAIYLRWQGAKDLSWGGFAVFGFVCFFIAAFQMWSEMQAKLDSLAKRQSCPKLFLRHHDKNPELENLEKMSGFFLQVEGNKKAFNVRVISPDCLSKNTRKLEMVWSNINIPVGNEAVPISVLCTEREGNSSYSMTGSQIEAYMSMRKRDSRELTAIITYKDIDGFECPPRRFRIYRERDVTGNMVTHCELITQAAS